MAIKCTIKIVFFRKNASGIPQHIGTKVSELSFVDPHYFLGVRNMALSGHEFEVRKLTPYYRPEKSRNYAMKLDKFDLILGYDLSGTDDPEDWSVLMEGVCKDLYMVRTVGQ